MFWPKTTGASGPTSIFCRASDFSGPLEAEPKSLAIIRQIKLGSALVLRGANTVATIGGST